MKNFTFLLVLLLPIFGFSQIDLVRWNGANIQPNAFLIQNDGSISASPVSGNFVTDKYSTPFPGFRGSGYNYNTTSDENNYIGFQFTVNSGSNIALNNFKFIYARGEGGATKFEVKYSTNGTTWISKGITTGVTTTPTSKTISLSDVSVVAGSTFYIRVYPFSRENEYWSGGTFHIKHGTPHETATPDASGPTISGTVSTACTPPTNSQTYGNNVWNGYVYTYANENSEFNSNATYIGTITETPTFDRDLGNGQVNGITRDIPCVTPPSDRFLVRYLMNTPSLTAGDYNFTVGADDGYRLFIDGIQQTDLSDWSTHSYGQKTKKITLTAGTHALKYEYFEREGGARVMFSYGKIKEDITTPFGNNVWNVYAYNSDTNANANSFVGSYVDPNFSINTENFWNAGTSPSTNNTAIYTGAPVTKDYFTTIYKRKGFPCGKYSIKLDKWDDDVVIILNGAVIESKSGNNSNFVLASNYILKPTDEIEVRLVERGGDAVLRMLFTDIPTVYSASSNPTAAQALGTSMRVEKNVSITENLNVCSCTVTNGYTLTIPDNKTITVQEGVTVENGGNLIVENNGSLVQVNDNATNSGSINVKRTTAPVKRYDFTYWSSPVGSGFTLYNLSPNTLGDKYYSYNPVSGWVIHYNGNQAMEAGKGYLVRAPQEYDINNPAVYNATFIGKPNNGIITQPVVANASNLIGNPYPSAISADAIYSANTGVIDGTFYFWTHNSLPSTANSGNATYNYSSDDYASYNGVGGVKTKSAVTGGQTPTGNIASGQSFFIAGKTSGNVTFSNSMRVKAGNNSQFFRTSNSTQSEQEPVTIEKNRLWLNISNEAGDFNETLIGYVSNATNGLDQAFDGVNLSSGTTTLYSIIDNNNLVIQGRALPFTNTDVVPLGMKISTAGQYTINMDQFDGLFTSQNIYLFDSLTNTTHDLKASDYVFNSEIGTFNSRFEIRYVNGTELGIDTPIVSNNDVIVYKSGSQIAVKATNFTIDNIQVYDLTGKVIFSKAKVNSNEFVTTGLNVGTQVVIVKVNLDNNQSVSKKVIMN